MDGSRKPISDYLSCNWGKVPSDSVVVSSAVSSEDRIKYQKFLQIFGERYGRSNGTFNSNSRNNQQLFGNRIQPEYDQFGNRLGNRFKRQNFDNTNTRDNQDPYNPYSNQNQDRSRNYNPYTNYNQQNNVDQNGKPNTDNNYNPYTNQNNNNYNSYNNDPYRTTESNNDPFKKDPFARDPYAINKDQYGVNIDPYSTDVKYNKDNDPIFETNNTYNFDNRGIFQNNGTNVTYYEEFHLFKSVPRYGWHGNLMFQVNLFSF